MTERVLVVGATGRVGSELVRLLAEEKLSVRAATRSPAAARSKLPASVEVVEFNFLKPATFGPALSGVDKVFLMARPGDNHSDQLAVPFIDAARQQRVRHVVNLTAMGVEDDSDFMLRVLECNLEASGIPFTHLRPNWFMQNFNSGPMFAEIQASASLHLPAADAKLSFIDARDVAAAAFAALTEPVHLGRAYTLTGGTALDHFAVAEYISLAAGRTITYVPVSEEAAQAALAKRGVADGFIARWTSFFRRVRLGLCAPVSPDLELLLGRPPISFAAYSQQYAASWK